MFTLLFNFSKSSNNDDILCEIIDDGAIFSGGGKIETGLSYDKFIRLLNFFYDAPT